MKQAKDLIKIGLDQTGFRYYQRAGIFKGNKGNCIFNPATGHATSYDWYDLAKRIKGVQILNTYCYSNQTAKHIGKVRSVLVALNIRYQCLEAPKGLQNLDVALEHMIAELGRATVLNKYARIKSKHFINSCNKQLKLLAKLGKRATKAKIKAAIERAEVERKDRNAELKFKRDKKHLENYLENSVAFRDYDIVDRCLFGNPDAWPARKASTVHRVVERDSMERDVENALHSFHRDGFGSIVFYVGGAR